VVLPNTDEKGGLRIANRIQRSVEAALAKTAADRTESPLTFRIGSATYDSQCQSVEELMHAAVAALKSGQQVQPADFAGLPINISAP